MSLRDTLKAANEKAAEAARAEADKPRIISEWKADVGRFNQQVRAWLDAYSSDGTILIKSYAQDYTEEYLGRYTAEAMELKAGPFIIFIRPVGRIIFGAIGRIDMYRQGRNDEGSVVRFLRRRESDASAWMIRKPQILRQHSAIIARPSEPEPLTAENFEEALDELLRS